MRWVIFTALSFLIYIETNALAEPLSLCQKALRVFSTNGDINYHLLEEFNQIQKVFKSSNQDLSKKTETLQRILISRLKQYPEALYHDIKKLLESLDDEQQLFAIRTYIESLEFLLLDYTIDDRTKYHWAFDLQRLLVDGFIPSLNSTPDNFKDLKSKMAHIIGYIESSPKQNIEVQENFYQGLLQIRLELEDIQEKLQNPNQNFQALIESLFKTVLTINGFYRVNGNRRLDAFIWKNLKEAHQIALELEKFMEAHRELKTEEKAYYQDKLSNLFKDQLIQWAVLIPDGSLEEIQFISEIVFNLKSKGCFIQELPQEWKTNLNSIEEWELLQNKWMKLQPLTEHSLIHNNIYMQIDRQIVSIRDTWKSEQGDFFEAMQDDGEESKGKLVKIFRALVEHEELMISQLQKASLESRFFIYKRLHNLWEIRRYLLDQLENLLAQLKKLSEEFRAQYSFEFLLLGNQYSFELPLVNDEQSYQIQNKGFLLYIGAKSLKDFEKREKLIKDLNTDIQSYPLEVLERIGSESDFEEFEMSLKSILNPGQSF